MTVLTLHATQRPELVARPQGTRGAAVEGAQPPPNSYASEEVGEHERDAGAFPPLPLSSPTPPRSRLADQVQPIAHRPGPSPAGDIWGPKTRTSTQGESRIHASISHNATACPRREVLARSPTAAI
jgi:hypothetical protein